MNKKLWITAFVFLLVTANYIFAQSPDDFRIEQLQDGTLSIESFGGKITTDTLVIPSHISGIPVTRIAFLDTRERMNNIKRVILPDTLRVIGSRAFVGFDLQEIVIPRGVIEIGNNAFMRNTSIHTVVIPSSVKLINMSAFLGCEITELYIESIFQLSPDAMRFPPFAGHTTYSDLKKITFPANWPNSSLESLGLPQGFINYYKSQGKKAGTYVLNGQIWTYAGAVSNPPAPRPAPTNNASSSNPPESQPELGKFWIEK